jgi:hypothetical protein
MKKFAVAAIAALAVSAAPAFAADMPVKAKPVAAPPPPAWDIAFGGAVASDYIWRGITQSNHQPSVASYVEPRYNVTKDVQLYVGAGGASIAFPNRAAAEIDFYAGVRPTFDKLSLDFGVWYYWYPGGQCFNLAAGCPFSDTVTGGLPINGNLAKADWSFVEIYAKASYAITDAFTLGVAFYYSPSVLNTGAPGFFYTANAKYVFPAMANGVQFYVSGDYGFWDLGTSDAFYLSTPYKDYSTWDLGVGFTWKVFTVDLRYIDTDLNQGDCNAFTSDHTATFNGSFTAINPGGFGSSWCGARFVGRVSWDLSVMSNLKP